MENFPQRLQDIILTLKVKGKDFAAAGDVAPQSLSKYLKGHANPALETIAKWTKTYGIDAHWLLTGEGQMFRDKRQGAICETSAAPTGAMDPITLRLEATNRLLRESNAPDTVIQEAIMTILRSAEPAAAPQAEKGRKSA